MTTAMDYVEFTRKPTRPDSDVIYEHATVPTFTLACYFERLLNPRHPEHALTVAFAHQIMARAHEEKLAMGRELMQRTRAAMTDDQWSQLVD